jgi:uncharacterized protein YunC (DUF1805 family)
MDTVTIDHHAFEGICIDSENAKIILIKNKKGFLGCGYFSVATANKLKEAVAIVRGVASYDDMLNATVVEISEKAAALGIKEGDSGKAALLKLV